MNASNLWQALNRIGADYSLPLTQALLHFLWQGGVVAIAYAVVARGLRLAPASARYVAGVAALLLMTASLPATLSVLPSRHMAVVDTANQPHASSISASTPATADQSVADLAEPELNVTTLPTNPSIAFDLQPLPSVTSEEVPIWQPAADRAASLLVRASPYASGLYLCGVVLLLLRVALGLWGGHRLRQACTPLGDGPIFGMLRDHARRMALGVIPVVAYCRQISVPVVVGMLRPMILLPASLASGLTPRQLEVVILHELTHVRRYDLAVNILQRLVEALLFFHPAVWWLSRQISAERENACDDLVVRWNCDPTQYADALLRVAELCATVADRSMIGKAALAATGESASQLKRRVLRLLDLNDKPALRLTTTGVVTSLLLIFSVILAPAAGRVAVHAEDAPGATKTSEPAYVGKNKNSAPQGQTAGAKATMMPETAERMASAKRIAAALQVLRVYNLHYGVSAKQREWTSAIRELIQIGTPAVPQLIQELDRTERDETSRALGFVLRGIGDPRAAPALVRAIPRALQAQSGDCGLRIDDDPEIMQFMQQHDISSIMRRHSPFPRSERQPGEHIPKLFIYGSTYNEVMPALEKLTGQSHGWTELCYVNDMGGVYERNMKRTLYVTYARRWADWWSKNWQKYVKDEADAQVDSIRQSLEQYGKSIPTAPNQQSRSEFPCGPNVTGYMLNDAFEGAFDEPSTRSLVDLDTGRCPIPPPELVKHCQGHEPSQELLAWASQERVNLITTKITPPGSDKSYYAFKPLGLKVWRLDNGRFDNIQNELHRSKRFELAEPWKGLLAQIDEKSGALDENLTVSFLFITSRGTCGTIQIQPPVPPGSRELTSGPIPKRGRVRYWFVYEGDTEKRAL